MYQKYEYLASSAAIFTAENACTKYIFPMEYKWIISTDLKSDVSTKSTIFCKEETATDTFWIINTKHKLHVKMSGLNQLLWLG